MNLLKIFKFYKVLIFNRSFSYHAQFIYKIQILMDLQHPNMVIAESFHDS